MAKGKGRGGNDDQNGKASGSGSTMLLISVLVATGGFGCYQYLENVQLQAKNEMLSDNFEMLKAGIPARTAPYKADAVPTAQEVRTDVDYLIVGAGPGGLQLAYYLQKNGRSYTVLERETIGLAFQQYPRHRKLISINKVFTGEGHPEFNMRHDWNSLLTDDYSHLFKDYSTEYWPHADDYVRYLQDFVTKYKLHVQQGVEVKDIVKDGEPDGDGNFVLTDQNGRTFTAKRLIMATGLSRHKVLQPPATPPKVLRRMETYARVSVDPNDFVNQTILIVGAGNAAYETAENLVGTSASIHLMTRSKQRFAWQTHYPGDLRAVNNDFLDTYQLKSLNGILHGDLERCPFYETEDGKLGSACVPHKNYDRVITATGWKFDYQPFVMGETKSDGSMEGGVATAGPGGKYPKISGSYESPSAKNMYVTGTAAHSNDFRKSSGAFVHGFRYNARALARVLEERHEGTMWTHSRAKVTSSRPILEESIKALGPEEEYGDRPLSSLTERLKSMFLHRMQTSAGMYQMFYELADVAIVVDNTPGADEDEKHEFEIIYYEEMPIRRLDEMKMPEGTTHVIAMRFEYGKCFSNPFSDTFSLVRTAGDTENADKSNFIHPVFRYYPVGNSEYSENQEPVWSKEPAKMSAEGDWVTVPSLHLDNYARKMHVLEDFNTDWHKATFESPLRRWLTSTLYPQSSAGAGSAVWDAENSRQRELENMSPEQCRDQALSHQQLDEQLFRILHHPASLHLTQAQRIAHEVRLHLGEERDRCYQGEELQTLLNNVVQAFDKEAMMKKRLRDTELTALEAAFNATMASFEYKSTTGTVISELGLKCDQQFGGPASIVHADHLVEFWSAFQYYLFRTFDIYWDRSTIDIRYSNVRREKERDLLETAGILEASMPKIGDV